MSDPRSGTAARGQRPWIPSYLQTMAAVVVATLTPDGRLLDANRGFLELLPEPMRDQRGQDVRDVFVHPRFDAFVGRRCDPADGAVVRGILNLGGAGGRDGEVQSLHGTVYRVDDTLMLVAEHDLAGLRTLTDKLLQLNADLQTRGRETGGGPRELALGERLSAVPRSFALGETMARADENSGKLFEITDGFVALFALLPDGGRQLLDFVLPGEFVGLCGDNSWIAECCTPTAALAYDRAALQTLLPGDQLLQIACGAVARSTGRLLETMRGGAPTARVARLLLDLFRRSCGRLPAADGEQVLLPVSQGLLAEALALRPETVSRALKSLREAGVLSIGGGYLTVLDHRAVTDVAAGT